MDIFLCNTLTVRVSVVVLKIENYLKSRTSHDKLANLLRVTFYVNPKCSFLHENPPRQTNVFSIISICIITLRLTCRLSYHGSKSRVYHYVLSSFNRTTICFHGSCYKYKSNVREHAYITSKRKSFGNGIFCADLKFVKPRTHMEQNIVS